MKTVTPLLACVAIACSLTTGCKKSAEATVEAGPTASTTASVAATAKQPEGPPTFKFEGKEYKFPYAWVYDANGPIVRLSTHAMGCGGGHLPDEAQTLDIRIGAGPGLKHFAGKATAVDMEFYPQKTNVELKTSSFSERETATLQTEPYNYAVGEHIKGTIKLDAVTHKADDKTLTYEGGGKFDAEICSAGDSGLQAFDEKAPEGPVTFTVGSKAFTAKTVLVLVMEDKDSSAQWYRKVDFFDADGVTCDNYAGFEDKGTVITIEGFGGASARQKLFGSPVHASMSLHKAVAKDNYVSFSGAGGGGGAWIQFDSLDFTAGAKIKGQAVGLSDRFAKPDNKTKLGGNFEATICAL
ncbi:hypothetical protein BH09MYX1_BH09MYX1_42980 [soil metagenome]